MGSSMLIGFNNDVEYKGRMFHIQTEDHGIKDGHITTILFFSGQILDSKKVCYLEDIEGVDEDEEKKKAIKKRMVDLHREFYKKLFDGTYEKKVEEMDPKDGKKTSSDEIKKAAPALGKPTPSSASVKKLPQSGAMKAAKKGPKSSSGTKVPKGVPTSTDKKKFKKGPPPLKKRHTSSTSNAAVSKSSSSTTAASSKSASSKAASSTSSPAVAARPTGTNGRKSVARPSLVSVTPISDKNPAFRGLLYPDEADLRIDGLVAEFLDSQ